MLCHPTASGYNPGGMISGEYEPMADTMISRRAGDDRTRALDAAISQIERAFGKGSVMRLGAAEQAQEIETVSTGSLGPRYRAGRRRPAAWPDHRDLRAGELGQDHAHAARHRRGAEGRRQRRLHRRRARARPLLRQEAGRQPGRPPDQPARHRRAGAGDRRHAGALRRHRRDRGRFGGGPGAQGRARGRDGRRPCRPAGAADEPGACASSPPRSAAASAC